MTWVAKSATLDSAFTLRALSSVCGDHLANRRNDRTKLYRVLGQRFQGEFATFPTRHAESGS